MSQLATGKVVNLAWCRYRSACYLTGRGLTWGHGNDSIVPQQAIDGGKYSLNVDIAKAAGTDICDTNIDFIVKASMDHVFVGARSGAPFVDLVSKLKIGGHLVVLLVDGNPEALQEQIAGLGYWQAKDQYLRAEGTQFLGIWKLLGRSRNGIRPQPPRATKRACIARYGAIGDMIIITPLIRRLAEDGYEVTMNITPYCAEVLKHNPYVHNIVIQERDMIPNNNLGEYWAEWMQDYDKYINLSESIEGTLLKVEERRDFYTTKKWRSSICNTNYYDNTMRLGGYPDDLGHNGEMYFSKTETKQAEFIRNKFPDKFVIMWALKGSSHHKIYPMLAPVLGTWLDNHPDAIAILVGAESDILLQFEHPQVKGMAGKTSLRDVFCLTKYVDLVVGPETSTTNASGCYDVPKITMLTHSTHENLCKHWVNDYCLQADVPCTGCHQLHYSMESCPCIDLSQGDSTEAAWSGPMCAGIGFPPAVLSARIDEVYKLWKAK